MILWVFGFGECFGLWCRLGIFFGVFVRGRLGGVDVC